MEFLFPPRREGGLRGWEFSAGGYEGGLRGLMMGGEREEGEGEGGGGWEGGGCEGEGEEEEGEGVG